MRRLLMIALAVGLSALSATPADPAAITKLGDVEFRGTILGANDVSAVAVAGDFLVIGSDEAEAVQVLKKDGAAYAVVADVSLGQPGHELDVEGVAAEGNTVYVTGSHNRVRYIGAKGGGGVSPVEDKPRRHRDQVFRFTLGPNGKPGPVEVMSLRAVLDDHPILKQFVPVASKENGIDIEGLAVKNGRLYFGFRGPVLRDNWVPILSCTFGKEPGEVAVAYARFGGRGVRDLVAVQNGFLVIAGPVGDGDQSYQIHFWDGTDGLAGPKDPPKPKPLAELPDFGKGKPEGLAVLKEDGKTYELLLVCDGLANGGPSRWRLTRP
jgi:hypothetical protein